MKPIWKNKQLTVELHKPERAILEKARDLGEQLLALHQPDGAPLVDAIDAILQDNHDEVVE